MKKQTVHRLLPPTNRSTRFLVSFIPGYRTFLYVYYNSLLPCRIAPWLNLIIKVMRRDTYVRITNYEPGKNNRNISDDCSLIINRFFIRSSFFKSLLHLLDGYLRRIVIDCIDFPHALPAFCYLADTGTPIQGCFTHIVSAHTENNLCFIGQHALPCHNNEKNKQDGTKSTLMKWTAHNDLLYFYLRI